MKKIKKLVRILLLLGFLGLSIYAVFNLFKQGKDVYEEQKEYDQLQEIITSKEPEEGSQGETEVVIDFEELRKINPNIVGWIIMDGTSISYPIVQGDDNSYYLKHSFYKKYNPSGAIFMESSASKNFSDQNTFVFGHHSSHGKMFSDLRKYLKKDFYTEYPIAHLYTPEGNYELEIFSAYVDKATSYSYQLHFSDDESFSNYISHIKSKSRYNTSIDVSIEDKIVSFYTCSAEPGSTKLDRYFVHTKLTPVN